MGLRYYHVTDRRNRESIREHGIDPNYSDTWRGAGYPYVWAWDNEHYSRALDWGAGTSRLMDIWHIDPEGLTWEPDPHAKGDSKLYAGGWATARIPPEHLIEVEEYVEGGVPWWEQVA
jgi:hypothetical protein